MATPRRIAEQRGSGLSGQARAQQGIPENVVPTGAPDEEALSEILQMLRGGQVGAERFIQLLSLLAGSTIGQDGQGPAGPMGPGGPPQGPMGPGGGGGQPSIQQLLG